MENPISKFTGTWHIVEMEMWSADYFNLTGKFKSHRGDSSTFVARRAS